MRVRVFLRYVLLSAFLAFILAGLSACAPSQQLGARPAADAMGAVEAYLQRYQPGPLPSLFQTTRVYDRHGTLLAELWDEGRRTWVSLDRISPHLINATIATEDASFYVNTGFDPLRIAGAALRNVQEGQIVSGASTITMQLARNLFLGPHQRYDQSMDRKMLEVGLAQELTTLFSKDELLEMYLNLLNYGRLAYGPEAAAQIYFGKSASELTLAEATLLAGIPQRPAELDPFRNLPAAKARQRIVLDLMVRHSYLSSAEADAVYAEPMMLNANPGRRPNLAPHFVQYVEDILDARLGDGAARRAGLQITTTLDLPMQNLAQKIVADKVAEAAPQYDLTNGALVAMHVAPNPLEAQAPRGEILAMVGSADFYNDTIAGQVNVAVRPRQPGSAIKPVLYATALNDNLISPATVIWDMPVTYTIGAGQVYTPTNYDDSFHGPVTARTALANSYNIPAVRLLHGVMVERMLESAQAMGIRSLWRGRDWYGLSLTLGGGEVTLLELTTAFAVLANGGVTVQPRAILAVTDSRGRGVDIYETLPARQVVSQAAAFLVTDILSDNTARTPMFGANSPLKLSRPAMAKTGTTTDWRDNWTVGYTRYLVTGVWAGNSDGHPMKRTSGLTGAAPIWHDFMEGVLADPAMLATLEASPDPADWQFQPPPDVEQRSDCPHGLACREGGELFTRAWLEAAGEAGPLADSVALAPTAPVYVDSGEGGRWTAYCQVEPAVLRPVLKLPGTFGLPQPTPEGQETGELAEPDPEVRLEQLRGVLWSLHNPTAVNLGPCDALGQLVAEALELSPDEEDRNLQVLVDLAAAMDANAGPVAGQTAIPVAQVAPGEHRYVLAQPITHHTSCPGSYIVGQVLNRDMAPVPGVHIVLVDQWGNRMNAVSKSGAADFGQYDFPIHYFANRYTLTVVDDAGNPISPPVVVDHLQGESGDAPCHTVIWRGG